MFLYPYLTFFVHWVLLDCEVLVVARSILWVSFLGVILLRVLLLVLARFDCRGLFPLLQWGHGGQL